MTDIRAGIAIGVTLQEFNRLQRVLTSKMMSVESDIAFLHSLEDVLSLKILQAQMMCKATTLVWETMIEQVGYPERGLMRYPASYYDNIYRNLFPTTQVAVERGTIVSLAEAVPAMMDDIGILIKTTTDEYNRRRNSLAQTARQ